MGNTTSKSKPAASQSSAAKRAAFMPKHESKSSEAKPASAKPAAPKPISSATQKPPCPLTEIKDTAAHITSFLDAKDLSILSRTSKSSQLRFSKPYLEQALLKAVFDANPEKVRKILAKLLPSKSKSIILTRTHILETYFSPKLNKKGCKRKWTNISPLEAAAWCGDIFLVRDLLLHVPPTQKPEACKQLKGILDRKESEENGTYLAPYRALIQAYETYNGQFNTLYAARNWKELDKLWNEVWQRQRLLPAYGLQEYCNDKPFDPLPSFTEPPKRSCYLYNDPAHPLDLDSMDFGYALYMGDAGVRGGLGAGCGWVGGDLAWAWRAGGAGIALAGRDHAAISRLCEVRTIELGNLIKELEGPKLLDESDLEEDKDSSARP